MTAAIAISLGVSVASSLLSYALTPTQKIETNRLNSLLVPKSDYGANMPWVWGRVRVPGNLIWATKKKEVKNKKKSGGKGGPKIETTEYTYYANFAVLLAECPFRPIVGINRIWFNSKLVYSVFGGAETIEKGNKFAADYMRVYLGDRDQLPDPLIASVSSVSSNDYGIPWFNPGRTNALATLGLPSNTNITPSYRDRSYLVFENLPLSETGNELPGVSVEIDAGATDLKQIVSDICTYCNVDFDADSLSGIPVDGFFVNSSDAAKEYLQVLSTAYHFEIVNRGGTLKFLRLATGRTRLSIPLTDLSARPSGNSKPESFTQKIPLAEELPSEINLTFIDKNLDFKENSVSVKNQTAEHDKPVNYNFPLVMSVSAAQTLANQLFFLSLNAESIDFELPLAYNYLEPGDEVLIDNKAYRINKLAVGANFLIKASAIAFDSTLLTRSWLIETEKIETGTAKHGTPFILKWVNLYKLIVKRVASKSSGTTYVKDVDYSVSATGVITPLATGSIPNNSEIAVNYSTEPVQEDEDNEIPEQGNTNLLVLDLPLIGDGDSDYGVYLTGGGGDNWSEASIYVSTNNSNYQFADSLETYGTYGTCSTVISTTVEVVLSKGELESVTPAEIAAGFNKALVGNEIIQFRTATLTATNTYTLSNLTRGLRGTESVTHSPQERFVLLTGDNSYIIRLPGTISDIGQTRYFKAPSPGQSLDEVTPVSLTIVGNALKPYSPINPVATKDEVNNITISWTRRDRKAGERTDYNNFPLSETSEKWEVEIYSGAILKRTISTTSNSANYSRENQITDFGAIQSNISLKVYQLSSIVGRGTPLSVTLTPTFLAATPAIISFFPVTGTGGTNITITGTGLGGVTSIRLNNLALTDLIINSGTTITATIPSGATSGKLIAQSPGGNALSPDIFLASSDIVDGSTPEVIRDKLMLLQNTQRLPSSAIILSGSEVKAVLSALTGANRLSFTAIDGLRQGHNLKTDDASFESRQYLQFKDGFFGENSTDTTSIGFNPSSSLASGLLVYYPFNSDYQDKLGRLNLTGVNDSTLTFNTGKIDSAVFFEGEESLELSNPLFTLGYSDFTLSFWINITQLGVFYAPVNFDSNSSENIFRFSLTTTNIPTITVKNQAGTFTSLTSTAIAVNQLGWHQVVFCYNFLQSKALFYFDGVLRSSATVALSFFTSPSKLILGKYLNNNLPQNTALDSFTIWTRLLRNPEISYLYNSGAGRDINPFINANPEADQILLPTDIRDYLQSLTGNNRLDASAIKNLPDPTVIVNSDYFRRISTYTLTGSTLFLTNTSNEYVRIFPNGVKSYVRLPATMSTGKFFQIRNMETTASVELQASNGSTIVELKTETNYERMVTEVTYNGSDLDVIVW